MQVNASKHEIASILKLMDKDQKGYLDFRSFSTSIKPDMSTQINVPRNDVYFPNLVPNKNKVQDLTSKTSQIISAAAHARKNFSPDLE